MGCQPLPADAGTFSEAHIDRYLAEFDFRYSHRTNLGVTDGERAACIAKGIEGKRLRYRPTH